MGVLGSKSLRPGRDDRRARAGEESRSLRGVEREVDFRLVGMVREGGPMRELLGRWENERPWAGGYCIGSSDLNQDRYGLWSGRWISGWSGWFEREVLCGNCWVGGRMSVLGRVVTALVRRGAAPCGPPHFLLHHTSARAASALFLNGSRRVFSRSSL